MRSFILVLLVISLNLFSFGQSIDSIKVYFTGIGNGEKYKIYFGNELLLHLKAKGPFQYSFSLGLEEKPEPLESLNIMRKGKCGFWYRNTGFQPKLEDKFFLEIIKDFTLKNRYAVSYLWSDDPPSYPRRNHNNENRSKVFYANKIIEKMEYTP